MAHSYTYSRVGNYGGVHHTLLALTLLWGDIHLLIVTCIVICDQLNNALMGIENICASLLLAFTQRSLRVWVLLLFLMGLLCTFDQGMRQSMAVRQVQVTTHCCKLTGDNA